MSNILNPSQPTFEPLVEMKWTQQPIPGTDGENLVLMFRQRGIATSGGNFIGFSVFSEWTLVGVEQPTDESVPVVEGVIGATNQ